MPLAEVLSLDNFRKKVRLGTDTSDKVQSVLERPFYGGDIVGAFVSNFMDNIRPYWFSPEMLLRANMQDTFIYNEFLKVLFEAINYYIFKQCGTKVIEILPHANQFILEGTSGERSTAFVKLETRTEPNGSTEDIYTDILLFVMIEGENVLVTTFSKGEIVPEKID